MLVATAADAADLFSLKSTTFEDGNPLHHTVGLNSYRIPAMWMSA